MSRKLLFLITEDWYFCSHRLPPARAAREAGFSVVVATRVNRHGDAITREGFKLLPIGLRRRSTNPIRELAAIMEIVRIYFHERPDIVHHVAMKPALYGSIAARVARVPGVVNAFAGLGFIFTSRNMRARILRGLLVQLFRLVLNTHKAVLIMQNPDDTALVAGRMVAPERIRLIRGSGVDLDRFCPSTEPTGTPVVMLASRMLWNKGLREFAEAATVLKSRNVDARFVLVGESDSENPAAVPLAQLESWRESGVVEWWGRREDMPEVLAQAAMVCLPSSYGEGVPKVLLEAAACGRALVATDAPGCREIVRHAENGLLVPLRDSAALAEAIEHLLSKPELRTQMGRVGRKIVEAEFSDSLVAQRTLAVYEELASSGGAA